MFFSSIDSGTVGISEFDNQTVFSLDLPEAQSKLLIELVPTRLTLFISHESNFRVYVWDDKSEQFDFHIIRDAIHDYYARTLLNQDFNHQALYEYVNFIRSLARKIIDPL